MNFCIYLKMEEEQKILDVKNKELEEAYKVKKKTLDLLPDAENNITKLQVKSIPCKIL